MLLSSLLESELLHSASEDVYPVCELRLFECVRVCVGVCVMLRNSTYFA